MRTIKATNSAFANLKKKRRDIPAIMTGEHIKFTRKTDAKLTGKIVG